MKRCRNLLSRRFIALVVFALVVTTFSGPALAAGVTITVNNAPVVSDVPAQIVDGRTLGPLRAVFELAGAYVNYDSATRTITVHDEDTVIRLSLDSREAEIDGQPYTLDVPPVLVSGRALVPVRFLGEGLGMTVQWVTGQNRVVMTDGSVPVSAPGDSASEQDVELLARLVYAEARGEPFAGQVAVAAVVLNRVESSDFPNTIRGVIYQVINGYHQFTTVANGTINNDPGDTARQAAREALAGSDPSNGAIGFYNPKTATSTWAKSRPQTAVIGNHVFFR